MHDSKALSSKVVVDDEYEIHEFNCPRTTCFPDAEHDVEFKTNHDWFLSSTSCSSSETFVDLGNRTSWISYSSSMTTFVTKCSWIVNLMRRRVDIMVCFVLDVMLLIRNFLCSRTSEFLNLILIIHYHFCCSILQNHESHATPPRHHDWFILDVMFIIRTFSSVLGHQTSWI